MRLMIYVDMAMCILRAYVNNGKTFIPEEVAKQFVVWKNTKPRDIGGTCHRTLAIVARGRFAFYRGGLDDWKKYPANSPNGSIMRNGAIPFLFPYPEQEIEAINASVLHSIITHFGPTCVLSCVIHTLLVRRALIEKRAPTIEDIETIINTSWANWKTQTLNNNNNEHCKFYLETIGAEVMREAEEVAIRELRGFESEDWYNYDYTNISGYSILTLKIALWAAYWSYRNDHPTIPDWLPKWPFARHQYDTIMWVALIGADSDTYCATAGPLLGALHTNIHSDFLENLVVKDEMINIFNTIYG